MSPDELKATAEAWKILSGFGVLGIIGAIVIIAFALIVFWAVFGIRRHASGLATKAHTVLNSAIEQQPLVLKELAQNTAATAVLAEAINKSKDMTSLALESFKPTPDHPFCSAPTEEALLCLCDMIQTILPKEQDDEIRHVLSQLVQRMRQVLQRKLGSRG